jgi:hypothetical protein
MCGPPDFDALHTAILRLGELSAAGLTGYSVYKVVSFCRTLAPKRGAPEEKPPRRVPGQFAVQGSSGRSVTRLSKPVNEAH